MWPFKKTGAPARQTDSASVTFLRREFSSHPARGLSPERLAYLLDNAEAGDLVSQAQLAEDMEEKDAHLFAELNKRKRALLRLEWDIEGDATPTGKRQAAALRDMAQDIPDFEDMILDMMDALLKGYSCQELEWRNDGGCWIPIAHHRPAEWFTVAPQDRNTLLLRSQAPHNNQYGDWVNAEPLRQWGWITHIHKSKSGWLPRAGLVRVLAWPYLFKNYSVRDLAELLEIYGIPVGLGRYPRNASETEKTTLLQALQSIGHNARGIIPEGMGLEFLSEAKGNSDPFQLMIDWCEHSMSRAIIGGTLASSADGGTKTNALGKVHEQALWDLVYSDARQIAGTLSRQLLIPLAELNGLTFKRPPKLVFDIAENEDITAFAGALHTLTQAGMANHIPVSWVRNRLRIPTPSDGEATLGTLPQTAALKFSAAAARASSRQDDNATPFLEQLGQSAEPVFTATAINPIKELLSSVDNYEEFLSRLDDLFPDMDKAALAAVLRDATLAAELAGRWDIENGD